MTLIHHVLFWLKRPGNEADRALLVSGLSTLGNIRGIRQMHIGFPAPTTERGVVDASYDVSELLLFDSVEDEARYQVDPVHEAFVRDFGYLWDKVTVYDALDLSPDR